MHFSLSGVKFLRLWFLCVYFWAISVFYLYLPLCFAMICSMAAFAYGTYQYLNIRASDSLVWHQASNSWLEGGKNTVAISPQTWLSAYISLIVMTHADKTVFRVISAWDMNIIDYRRLTAILRWSKLQQSDSIHSWKIN